MKKFTLVIGYVVMLFLTLSLTAAFADVGPKTAKAIDDVNAAIKECGKAAKVLVEWSTNFHNNTKAFRRDNVEIKHFDADSLSHTSFTRRSKTWRQVKDQLKAAIKKYNSKCKKITEKLKKIDKFKKGDTFR